MTSKKFHASQRRDMILSSLEEEGLVTVPMIAKLCHFRDDYSSRF